LHKKWLRSISLPVPPELQEIEQFLNNQVREGQEATPVDRLLAASCTVEPTLLVDVSEAARRLDCSTSTTKRFIKSGDLSSVMLGGLRRVRVVDLNRFVEGLSEGNQDAET
jgi:excisionase family DNA binding protein